MSVDIRDPRAEDVLDGNAGIERLATGFEFVEGPVWHGPDRYLVFSDIIGDTMHRWTDTDGITVFRQPSNMANGNALDPEGRLVTCEHATSRLVRMEHDGSISVLASHYDGRELNSPNDVIVDDEGVIFFTDPDSGRKAPWGVPRERDLPFCGVYRLGTDGDLTLLVDDFVIPNGLCFSLDGARLFVNDTARRHIRVFELQSDGTMTGGEVWADVGGVEGERPPDGMKIDTQGNLFCTGPGGIHVFADDGTRIGVIEVPENVANFAWGDADLQSLYITASTSLYRTRVKVPGLPSF